MYDILYEDGDKEAGVDRGLIMGQNSAGGQLPKVTVPVLVVTGVEGLEAKVDELCATDLSLGLDNVSVDWHRHTAEELAPGGAHHEKLQVRVQ